MTFCPNSVVRILGILVCHGIIQAGGLKHNHPKHQEGLISPRNFSASEAVISLSMGDLVEIASEEAMQKMPIGRGGGLAMLALASSAVMAACAYAMCGLGFGTIFHSMAIVLHSIAHLPFGLVQTAHYIMVVMPFATLWQANCFRGSEDLNFRLASVYAVFMLVGMLAGHCLLIASAHDPRLIPVLESVLLSALLMCLAMEAHKAFKPEEMKLYSGEHIKGDLNLAAAAVLSVMTGVFQGSIAIGSPAKILMILVLGLSKDEWRACQSVADLPFQAVRLGLVLHSGFLSWKNDGLVIACIFAGTAFGLVVGSKVDKHVSQKMFQNGMVSVMALASVLVGFSLLRRLNHVVIS